MARTSYILKRWWWWWWWCPLCTRPTCLVGLLIVLAHWKNCLWEDMSLHSTHYS